jgi:hypothetical protein
LFVVAGFDVVKLAEEEEGGRLFGLFFGMG